MDDEGESTSSRSKSQSRKLRSKGAPPKPSGSPASKVAKKRAVSLIDKSLSVEQETLAVPLEPERLHMTTSEDNIYNTLEPLVSILRKGSEYDGVHAISEECAGLVTCKSVSFADSEASLTDCKEPDDFAPYKIEKPLTTHEIIQIYENSCAKNNVIEIDSIKTQLKDVTCNLDRSAVLNINNVVVTFDVLETFEELFKVMNFYSITVADCTFTSYTMGELFVLLEYYDSTSELILAVNIDDVVAWKHLDRFIALTNHLNMLSFKSVTINETNMKSFLAALKDGQLIKVLKFDSCTLAKLPNFYLVECLENYTLIKELHLLQTGLYAKEADCIGKFLAKNNNLQVLNVSNNVIGDRGLEQLAKGLTRQRSGPGVGLSALIIYNNQLTEKSGKNISSIIEKCKNLRILNLGFNHLTDNVIYEIKESLKSTKTLEGLGLQSTILTCIGAACLAETIDKNTSLQNINLRGNKAIYIVGLEKLSKALINTKIERIELDETNRSSLNPEAYSEVVKKIKEICTVNKLHSEQSEKEQGTSQLPCKVSLNCEPYYNTPSPLPSQTCPASRTRSRFQVSKVTDSSPSKPTNASRFKVVAVPNFVENKEERLISSLQIDRIVNNIMDEFSDNASACESE